MWWQEGWDSAPYTNLLPFGYVHGVGGSHGFLGWEQLNHNKIPMRTNGLHRFVSLSSSR